MAKKTIKKSNKMSGSQKVGIGVGLTTAAVAAAGAYFLYGSPNASKNRKKVKGWMLKAKGEVLEALEKADQMTEKEFDALIKSVSGVYAKVQSVSKSDINDFQKEMKSHWKKLAKETKGRAKAAKRSVKKAVKKRVKKTAKKTTKKSAKKTAKKK